MFEITPGLKNSSIALTPKHMKQMGKLALLPAMPEQETAAVIRKKGTVQSLDFIGLL